MPFEEICTKFPRVDRDYDFNHVSPSLSAFRALRVETKGEMVKRMATTIHALTQHYSSDNIVCVSHASPSQTLVGCVLFGAHHVTRQATTTDTDTDTLLAALPFGQLGSIGVCGIYQCVREYDSEKWSVVRNGDVKHLSSGLLYPWHWHG